MKAGKFILFLVITLYVCVGRVSANFVAYETVQPSLNGFAIAGPKLDTKQFGLDIHQALKSTGYVMQLQQHGQTIHSQYWGWARMPLDGGISWHPDVPMHVASVSKLITAIGMKKLLLSRGISLNEKITDYLPGQWQQGLNIDEITFRQLLTHRSGFSGIGSRTNYSQMKAAVENGVAITGMHDYENVNFSLCRILSFFILYGQDIDEKYSWSDQTIDSLTSYYYNKYMQDYIFKPSGVLNATTVSNASHALAYPGYVASTPGNQTWNPQYYYSGGSDQGDLTGTVGGVGWIMSTNELLKLMHSFRQQENIMSKDDAQRLLDDKLGLDVIETTAAGTYYHKNGAWGPPTIKVQSLIYLLPNNMELAVYVNSPVPPGDNFLRAIVTNIYKANIEDDEEVEIILPDNLYEQEISKPSPLLMQHGFGL